MLLRRGARIAGRVSGHTLVAVHVVRSDGGIDAQSAEIERQRLLAERLGGSFQMIVGDGIAAVGPELTTAGVCLSPEEIVESVLWPRRKVKEGYEAIAVATDDGKVVQGYKQTETGPRARPPRRRHGRRRPDRQGRRSRRVRAIGHADARGAGGHDVARRAPRPGPVPDGPGPAGRRGHPPIWPDIAHARRPTFPFDREPLQPELWPHWQAPRQPRAALRLLRQGGRVLPQAGRASRCCCPRSPASTAAARATGATRTRTTWADGRWNQTDLGTRALRRLPRRGRDRAQGRLRPARRARRAGRLLQPRDALLRGRLARRLRQVLAPSATASWTA